MGSQGSHGIPWDPMSPRAHGPATRAAAPPSAPSSETPARCAACSPTTGTPAATRAATA